MSYVHCHSCDWSQDDFWDFRLTRGHGYVTFVNLGKFKVGWEYNPLSLFLSYVATYLKPRRIDHDLWIAKEKGWRRKDPHSWWLIGQEFKKVFWRFKRQHWWFEKQFFDEVDKLCPKCGARNLDVD